MTAAGMGYQLAEAEWARTLAVLNGDGGVALYPIEDDCLDRADEARRAREDEWREERDL